MLYNLNLSQVLFLDIETVPALPAYEELSDKMKKLWDRKAKYLKTEEVQSPDELYERAGIYSEFGRIVCISVGMFNGNEFRLKSFYGDDEKIFLTEFAEMLSRHYNHPQQLLCAHNGKEFDFPYIARRMLINGIELPEILQMAGKKPWEIRHLDTMEMWKFGDYKHYTSLSLLCELFNIPTPKDDIDGSQVSRIYWEENDLDRIVRYCEKDTLAVANLLLKYKGDKVIPIENMEVV